MVLGPGLQRGGSPELHTMPYIFSLMNVGLVKHPVGSPYRIMNPKTNTPIDLSSKLFLFIKREVLFRGKTMSCMGDDQIFFDRYATVTDNGMVTFTAFKKTTFPTDQDLESILDSHTELRKKHINTDPYWNCPDRYLKDIYLSIPKIRTKATHHRGPSRSKASHSTVKSPSRTKVVVDTQARASPSSGTVKTSVLTFQSQGPEKSRMDDILQASYPFQKTFLLKIPWLKKGGNFIRVYARMAMEFTQKLEKYPTEEAFVNSPYFSTVFSKLSNNDPYVYVVNENYLESFTKSKVAAYKNDLRGDYILANLHEQTQIKSSREAGTGSIAQSTINDKSRPSSPIRGRAATGSRHSSPITIPSRPQSPTPPPSSGVKNIFDFDLSRFLNGPSPKTSSVHQSSAILRPQTGLRPGANGNATLC